MRLVAACPLLFGVYLFRRLSILKTEVLSLLTVRSQKLNHIPGGYSKTTPQDIAASLAGMRPYEAYQLALFLYSEDESAFNALHAYALGMKPQPRIPNDMIGSGIDPIRQIVITAIGEIWANQCGKCNGAGVDPDQQTCSRCKGHKFKRQTNLSRARACRIPGRDWPVYKVFYDKVCNQLLDWHCDIERHLSKKFQSANESIQTLPAKAKPHLIMGK